MIGVQINNKLILDGHKLSYHDERVNDWLDNKPIAPIMIDMALTQDCNYKCTYCYAYFQRNEKYKITKDIIVSFLHDCADLGVKAITFTGDGESTLSPVYQDAVLLANELGIDVATSTHGQQLHRHDLKKILPCLTYIRINISAATPNRYARIHGVSEEHFYQVKKSIAELVEIKKELNLKTTIGLQMVLMPDNGEDILPLAQFAVDMGVDYLVIKHCSDDNKGSLGINYEDYHHLKEVLDQAQELSNETTQITAKLSKLYSGGKRNYSKCFGPMFQLQISGTGLVAPCGDLFSSEKKDYHIGNICHQSFKEIITGERYKEVMSELASGEFDPRKKCGSLCLQHHVNQYLFDLKENGVTKIESKSGAHIQHKNFI